MQNNEDDGLWEYGIIEDSKEAERCSLWVDKEGKYIYACLGNSRFARTLIDDPRWKQKSS